MRRRFSGQRANFSRSHSLTRRFGPNQTIRKLCVESLEPRHLLSVDLSILKDINVVGSAHSNPIGFTEANGLTFFFADNELRGRALWRTDGTEVGTFPLTNGHSGSSLINFNSTLFFASGDLWTSDGTEAGTTQITDILRGNGNPGASNLTMVDDTLFFTAVHENDGRELWRSDGTASGTNRVRDIHRGSASSNPSQLTNVNGLLYFLADDGDHGEELWVSDGTGVGTQRVKDIQLGAGDANIEELINVNGMLFFRADDGISGRELWRSDGTESGTFQVADIAVGSGNSTPRYLANIGDTLFFAATDVRGTELWKSDGSEIGTVQVKDIAPLGASSRPEALTVFQGALYFSAADQGSATLWKSDGTASGTVQLTDARTEGPFVGHGDYLYFSAYDHTHGSELWRSDGTAAGTHLFDDIYLGSRSSGPDELFSAGNRLYFEAWGENTGRELWGVVEGGADAELVKDIDRPSSEPAEFTNVNGTLFFRAYDPATGYELWKSDGTPSGTHLVKDIFPGERSAIRTRSSRNLVNFNGTLFFVALEPSTGYELWKTDGTEAGTVLVKDVRSGSGSSLNTLPLVPSGNSLFFVAMDHDTGSELWKTDGTEAGTHLVKDINPNGSTYPQSMTDVDGTLFFSVNGQLWKSDGTESGTTAVEGTNGFVRNLVNVNGTLFFATSGGLWKSDGTETGTYLVAGTDVISGAYPGINVNGILYFSARDADSDLELWRSDGTEAGTYRVRDIWPNGSSQPALMGNLDGLLYFQARFENDRGLWVSDGTENGTLQIFGETVDELSHGGGHLFFSVLDNSDGKEEPWISDGTLAGTYPLEDLTGNELSSSPTEFTVAGDRLYLSAQNERYGREIWSGVLGTRPGDFDRNSTLDPHDVDALVDTLVDGVHDIQFDLNHDGFVTGLDLEHWLELAGAANLPTGNPIQLGDANLDGSVDGQDFILWNQNKFTATAKWSAGDFNADGAVDGQDFVLWNINKFTDADDRQQPLTNQQVWADNQLSIAKVAARPGTRFDAELNNATRTEQSMPVAAASSAFGYRANEGRHCSAHRRATYARLGPLPDSIAEYQLKLQLNRSIARAPEWFGA